MTLVLCVWRPSLPAPPLSLTWWPSPSPPLRSTGGVTLFSNGGRVMLENTFESRLEIAYQQNLPSIRNMLFGADDDDAAAA